MTDNWNQRFILLFLVILSPLLGCSKQEEQATGPKYGTSAESTQREALKFAVLPYQTSQKIIADYLPFIEYLNQHVDGSQFALETSKDFKTFEDKIQNDKIAFIMPNPYETLLAIKAGYKVIAMAGNAKNFKGLFVARRDSEIHQPVDLKGKIVSFAAPTSLAGCIMPQYYLHTNGIDINKDITNNYAGSFESAIFNVYLREAAAAGTSIRAWRLFQEDHPQESKEMQVLWETDSLVNNSVMARADIPSELVEKVRTILIGLHESSEGQALLKKMEMSQFSTAMDQDYEVVNQFITTFEKEVRPVNK